LIASVFWGEAGAKLVENGAEEIGPGLLAQAGGFGALGGGLASVFFQIHAEVTVPSLDDWEKEWGINSPRSVQPKLLPADFQSSPTAISQAN